MDKLQSRYGFDKFESGTNILNETDIIFRFGLDTVLDIRVRVNTAMNIGYRLPNPNLDCGCAWELSLLRINVIILLLPFKS